MQGAQAKGIERVGRTDKGEIIMKAKLKKTGEIVDVICYGGTPHSRSAVSDYVNYIDSQGVEHTEHNNLNYYWDFEPIETATDEHWQDVRERTAIAAMLALLANPTLVDYNGHEKINIITRAMCHADELIEELKKK